jgi:hypothetical protein
VKVGKAEKPLDRIASPVIIPTVKHPSIFGSSRPFFLRHNWKAAEEDVLGKDPEGNS